MNPIPPWACKLFIVTLRAPYYAQTKAFYLLAALLPLSVVSAEGLAAPLRWLGDARFTPWGIVYCSWLGALGAVLLLSYLG